jgi:hypothetical protein
MPLDLASLDSGTPTAKDGRTYPKRLKQYERFDEVFLPIFEGLRHPISFDDLIDRVDDRRARAAAANWIDSASWRGLIQLSTRRSGKPNAWKPGPRLPANRAA